MFSPSCPSRLSCDLHAQLKVILSGANTVLRIRISQPCFTCITLTITHQQLQLQSLGPPYASD